MRATIAGGGVAGAASAVALARTGAEVTVLEAAEDPAGPAGSFLSVAANGLRALDALGCLAQVQAAGFAVPRQRMWAGSGKLLGDVPRARTAADPLISVTMMRRDLVAALRAEAARLGARIVTGHCVTSASAAGLAAGPGADLIVGADGIWSAVRTALDPGGPEPRYAGLYSVSGTTGPMDPASPALARGAGAWNMIYGRNGAFIYLPAPDGSVWWSAQVAAPVPPELRNVTLADLASLFRAEKQAAAIIGAAREELSATLLHVLPPVTRTYGADLVLVGDAAHPVGAGQGASMALEDAVILARQLRQAPDLPDALAAYDGIRRERTGKMAKTAAANRDAKTAGPVAARLRNLLMPVFFPRLYPRATAWLYDYDPGPLDGHRDFAGARQP